MRSSVVPDWVGLLELFRGLLEPFFQLVRFEPDAAHHASGDLLQPGAAEKALIVSLNIDMVYGSRANRYWVGFGAGKGSVDSVLTVSDSQTGEQKFRAVAESDLSVGGFGGNMEDVLKKNVRELVDQYPRAPDDVR